MCRPLITPLANLKSKRKHRAFSKNYELDFIDYTYNGRDLIGEHVASVGLESTLIEASYLVFASVDYNSRINDALTV